MDQRPREAGVLLWTVIFLSMWKRASEWSSLREELRSRGRKKEAWQRCSVSGIQLWLKRGPPLDFPVTWANTSSSLLNLGKCRFLSWITRWILTNSLTQEHGGKKGVRDLSPLVHLMLWADDKDTPRRNAEIHIFSPCSHSCVIPVISV